MRLGPIRLFEQRMPSNALDHELTSKEIPMPGFQVTQLAASVGCEILSVEPPQPIEFTPIWITVRITNAPAQPFSGDVRYTGQPSWADRSFYHVNIPAGPGIAGVMMGQQVPTRTVTFSGLAPAAGQNVPIEVQLFRDPAPAEEFTLPIATASFALNIAATYRFGIDTLECLNPRSKNNDTLKGSCKVLVGDQYLALYDPGSPWNAPQDTYYEEYGDHGAGFSTPTKFHFQEFGGVPGLAPNVAIVYNFENSGHAGSIEEVTNKVLDGLSDLGAGVVTGIEGGGDGWAKANEAHHQFNAAITASCDGLVAGDTLGPASSDQLASMTAENRTYTETRRYEGTSSPYICGEVSHYEVTFTLTRVSTPQQAIG
jgi:hypothetical protein